MVQVQIIIEYLSGILLLSAFGWLIGRTLGLNKFWKDTIDNDEVK